MITTQLLTTRFFLRIKDIGRTANMDDYERRKLSVFNQLNFLGLLSGLSISIAGLFDQQNLPWLASFVAFSPALISAGVLWLNHLQKYELARIVYFTFYPILTALVYSIGIDVGIELFFVLYAVLGVFYMKRPENAVIAFLLSATCYIITFVIGAGYEYQLREALYPFYVMNHCVALLFIFFSLFWIKKENTGYQASILEVNEKLIETNLAIEEQKDIIAKKVEQLSELNGLKNKLFSVISHDLKTPVYALRNLFRNVEKHDIPGDELKLLVPDILADLNYTTSLMENLLQWAKSQMQADSMQLQRLDITELINNTTKLLRLQAQSKKVVLQNKIDQPLFVYADKDMLDLVLRNLVSNAIKFTPEEGTVTVEVINLESDVEVIVQDTGIGMTEEVLEKLSKNNFYTSHGTANESGTGLGLMLCKEFLKKIGSKIYIESESGKGSTFSFTLPKLN